MELSLQQLPHIADKLAAFSVNGALVPGTALGSLNDKTQRAIVTLEKLRSQNFKL